MNRKQLILLIVILAVLGAGGYYTLKKQQQPSYAGAKMQIGEKLIADFPLNDVAAISILQPTQQLHLAKSGEIWTVKERGDYPANFGNISDVLRKIWELKVVKPVNVTAARLPALELVPPDKGPGTQIDFQDDKGKTIQTLILGAKHMRDTGAQSPMGMGGGYADGRYVMVGTDGSRVALVSEAFSNLEPKPSDWLNKDFFKVEKIKSIAVTTGVETNDWKIIRDSEGGTWNLADPKEHEKLDSSKVSSANYLLSSPYFNDVVVNPDPAALGLDAPRTAQLETFEGFSYTVKIGKAGEGDNYPLQVAVNASLPAERVAPADEKPEDKEKLDKEFKEQQDKLKEKLAKEKAVEKWTYEVSKWSVDFLLKDRKDLLAEEKKEEAQPEATSSNGGTAPLPNPFPTGLPNP